MIRNRSRALPTGVALVAVALAAVGLAAAAAAGESGHARLGIVVKESREGVRNGARVIEVFGPRAGRDLRRGDLVIRVGGMRVHDGAEIRDVLREIDDDPIVVEVVRRGERRRIEVDRLGGPRRDDDRVGIRRVRRDVRRDVIQDLRRDVRVEVRDGRDRLREELLRLRRELAELRMRLDAESIR
jgi:hypothetical protein